MKRKDNSTNQNQKKKKIQDPISIIDNSLESCKVLYFEDFLSKKQQNDLIKELDTIPFKKEVIQMFGKSINAPREIFSFGDSNLTYQYAGKIEKCEIWNSKMKEIRDIIFENSKIYGDTEESPFNFVLLNKYKDGNDYIGNHADNEKDIIPRSCIASLSLGVDRDFHLIHNQTKKKTTIKLRSGSLLLMLGRTQQYYKHGLPRRKKVKAQRYNLTFRHLK